MKLFTALLIGLTSTAFAQTTTEQQSTSFNFNQANLAFNLDQKDFQTIYRTDQVPDTCYRDEIQGTRTECHTEYDRQCHTTTERLCHNQNFPVCTNIPRRECHTTQNCHNERSQVCNSHGCTTINRRVCNPSQSCRTTNDRVCHQESRRVCENVNRQTCENIPRNVCNQVPNHVRVPYACMRAVQVPIGQELKFHTVAQVAINLVNFAEVGATSDVLVAKLDGGMVSFTALTPATNAYIYQIVDEQRSEQMTSSIEKNITYKISVVATSIQKLNEFSNSQILNAKLYTNHLEFNALGSLNIPLKGHLKIVEYYRRKQYIIINADFASNILVRQAGVEHLTFAPFGINALENATHLVELSLSIDLAKLQGGVINPGALMQVSSKSVLSSFEAIPAAQ